VVHDVSPHRLIVAPLCVLVLVAARRVQRVIVDFVCEAAPAS
jgi:hypothetical protein